MPLRMCYNSKFGRSTSKGDKAVVGRNPQNWAALETRWDGVMVHPKTRPFLMSYHAKFVQIWSFYAKGHRHLGYPKNKSTLGPTQWDGSVLPLTNTPLRLLVKWYKRTHRHLLENLVSSRPAFQGHSRSSELTDINRVPMTSY